MVARLQIIYVGEKDAQISFEGKIIDAEVTNVQPLGGKYKFIKFLIGFFPGVLFVLIIENIGKTYRSYKSSNKSKAIISSLIAVILMGASIVVYIFIFKGPSPPV